MKKALTILAVLIGAMGLLGLIFVLVPARTAARTGVEMPPAPGNTTSVASFRGLPAGASVTGTVPGMAYVPIAPQDLRSTTLYVQNAAGDEATVHLALRDREGSIVHQATDLVSAHGSLVYELANIGGIPSDFEGSVAITSTRSIYALANAQPAGSNGLLSYRGVPTGTDEVVLPAVHHDYNGWDSVIVVQNVGGAPAEVTIDYHPVHDGLSYPVSDSIPVGGVRVYEQSGMSELGTRFSGWAHVQSNQPIVAVAELWNSANGAVAAHNGLSADAADRRFYVPHQYTGFLPDWPSGLLVSNFGAQAAAITTTWRLNSGASVSTVERSGVPFGQPEEYLLQLIVPDGLNGAASGLADQPVGVLNILTSGSLADGYALSEGTGLAQADTTLYVPRADHVLLDGVSTWFSIQNTADATAAVTVTLYDRSGGYAATLTGSIPGLGFERFASADAPSLGDQWEGSAVIHASQPVALEVVQYLLPKEYAAYLPIVVRSKPLENGNFESGPSGWEQYSYRYEPHKIVQVGVDIPEYVVTARSGTWIAWLSGGYETETCYIQQTFSVPSSTPYLAYWVRIYSSDACGNDSARVFVNDTVVDQLDLCESKNSSRWSKRVVDLRPYVGNVTLRIQVDTDSSDWSNLYVDDVSLQASP